MTILYLNNSDASYPHSREIKNTSILDVQAFSVIWKYSLWRPPPPPLVIYLSLSGNLDWRGNGILSVSRHWWNPPWEGAHQEAQGCAAGDWGEGGALQHASVSSPGTVAGSAGFTQRRCGNASSHLVNPYSGPVPGTTTDPLHPLLCPLSRHPGVHVIISTLKMWDWGLGK